MSRFLTKCIRCGKVFLEIRDLEPKVTKWEAVCYRCQVEETLEELGEE